MPCVQWTRHLLQRTSEKRTFVGLLGSCTKGQRKTDTCTAGHLNNIYLKNRRAEKWALVQPDICGHLYNRTLSAFTSVQCPFSTAHSKLVSYRYPVVQLSGFTCVHCTSARGTTVRLYKCLVVHASVVQLASWQLSVANVSIVQVSEHLPGHIRVITMT